MASLTHKVNDVTFVLEDYEPLALFTDVDGNEVVFTTWGLYDPVLLEKISSATHNRLCAWLAFNWEKIRESFPRESDVADILNRNLRTLTDGDCDFSGESYNQYIEVAIRDYNPTARMNERVWTGVYTQYKDYSSLRTRESFELVPLSPQEARNLTVHLNPADFFRGSWRVGFSPSGYSSTQQEEILGQEWTSVLNYTHDSTGAHFNPFRFTPRDKGQESYLGMEIEVCTKLSPVEMQHIVTQLEPRQEPFFIFKSDVTISGRFNNRYEIVTVPATARYLRAEWRKFFNKLDQLVALKGKTVGDYFDLSPSLCNGLHIHISRKAFNQYDKMHMKKFLTLLNMADDSSKKFLSDVSCRSDYTSNTYSCPSQSYRGRTVAHIMRNVAMMDGHRGVTSTRNRNTLEVRLFHGQMNYRHFAKCIEFVTALCEFSGMMPFSKINWRWSKQFKEFVKHSPNYRNLRAELK